MNQPGSYNPDPSERALDGRGNSDTRAKGKLPLSLPNIHNFQFKGYNMNTMKRFLIAVLAVLLASGAMAQQPPFPDVPAGHWAEDAVARIADLGIVIGFPDGTFRGNEGFTRYQAALVVSRLLDVIAEDIAAAQALTAEDLAALRNAVQELASDLAALGVRVGDVEADVDMLRADVAVLEDVPMRLADIEALVTQLIEAPDLEDLRNRVAQLELAVEAALARAEAAEALALEAVDPDVALRIDEFARQLEGLNEVVRMLTESVDDLEEGFSPAGTKEMVVVPHTMPATAPVVLAELRIRGHGSREKPERKGAVGNDPGAVGLADLKEVVTPSLPQHREMRL
jgi:hypothetical protein